MTAGGGIEDDLEGGDPLTALHREVLEELGGTIEAPSQILVAAKPTEGGIVIHHVFLARLAATDLGARTGPQFTDPRPGSGTYEVQRVEFTATGIRGVNLVPPQLADCLCANAEGLLALAASGLMPASTPRRGAA